MHAIRLMHDGLADMTGERVGTLRIDCMVSRRPEPKYSVTCERCNTVSTATHSRLRSGAAVCQYTGCGKPSKQRSRLAEERRSATERENQHILEDQLAAERRMAAECEDAGWERPTRYTPDPVPPVMTDRNRRSLRDFREEQAEEQRRLDAPRLEAERVAAEQREAAEAEQRRLAEGRRQYWAGVVQSDPDPKFFVTDAMRNASMPTKDAAELEYAFYRTPENADVILAYLHNNGCFIADKETIRAAFVRLRDLGLLSQKPAPVSPPSVQPRPVSLSAQPVKSVSGSSTFIGRDHTTGREREFTRVEVNRMSSAEYAKAFKVLPSVAELFTAMSGTR